MQVHLKRLRDSESVRAAWAGAQQAYARSSKALAPAAQRLAPLQHRLQAYADPAVEGIRGGAQQLRDHLAPLWLQVQRQSAALAHQAEASITPYVHQLSARVSALVHWRSSE